MLYIFTPHTCDHNNYGRSISDPQCDYCYAAYSEPTYVILAPNYLAALEMLGREDAAYRLDVTVRPLDQYGIVHTDYPG